VICWMPDYSDLLDARPAGKAEAEMLALVVILTTFASVSLRRAGLLLSLLHVYSVLVPGSL